VSVVAEIKQWWGWVGIDPVEVVAMNAFGNLLIRDTSGKIWRLCPEDLYCRVVAGNDVELGKLLQNADFAEDWEMRALVRRAHDKLGPLTESRRYHLKIPAPLGGAYDADNMSVVPIEDIISFSGHVANQIKDLPDGAQVRFKVVD
jgi:hypothetical protein